MLIIQIWYLDWMPIIIQCTSNSLRAKHSTSYEKYAKLLFSYSSILTWGLENSQLPDKNIKFRNTVVLLLYRIPNFLISCQYNHLSCQLCKNRFCVLGMNKAEKCSSCLWHVLWLIWITKMTKIRTYLRQIACSIVYLDYTYCKMNLLCSIVGIMWK